MIDKFEHVFTNLPPRATGTDNREVSALAHTDVSANNLLIDLDTKDVTRSFDWENVSAVPLQAACTLPEFLILQAKPRFEAPDPQEYPNYDLKIDTEYNGAVEGKCDSYVKALIENQKTTLSIYFLEEIKRIWPSWIEQYHRGAPM